MNEKFILLRGVPIERGTKGQRERERQRGGMTLTHGGEHIKHFRQRQKRRQVELKKGEHKKDWLTKRQV